MINKQKNGISLIVLIITIIVMIILATTVIISLNNSNIIDNATQAVNETDLKNIQTIASLAWGEAYINGKTTQAELEQAVVDALDNNNVDKSKYTINVTPNGVDVDIYRAWVYKEDPSNNNRKTIITNGKVDLKIGSSITYEPTGTAASYTGGWQVLGAEDGKLLILSKGMVNTSKQLFGREGYKNAISELDEECAPFATGKDAISARSIKVEDVNKITGYNPNNVGLYDPEQTGSGTKYNVNQLNEYGNQVTYSSDGTTKPTYTSTNGVNSTLSTDHNPSFYYYEKTTKDWQTYTMTTTGTITTLTNDYYFYNPSTLTTNNSTTGNGIATTSDAYKMLFTNGSGTTVTYWLASLSINTAWTEVGFCVRSVNSVVGAVRLARTNTDVANPYMGVRAVVTLKSNINVTGNNEIGWSY